MKLVNQSVAKTGLTLKVIATYDPLIGTYIKLTLLVLSILILNTSCVKDVDLDQLKTSTFKTSMTLSYLKEDLNQQDFLDSSNEVMDYNNTYIIGIDGLFKDNIKDSISHTIITTNTFSDRSIQCFLKYADKNNNLLHITDSFTIPKDTYAQSNLLIYEGEKYQNFIKANFIIMTLKLGSSDLISDPPPNGEFHLQSKIGFTIERIITQNN